MKSKVTVEKSAVGCLVGLHYGDSSGAPVERLRLETIRKKFSGDVDVCQPALGRPAGVFTDDTAMALAFARGIAAVPWQDRGRMDLLIKSVWQEFMLWGESLLKPNSRGGGGTCKDATLGKIMGTLQTPLNDSDGNGGLMRVAPAGILYRDDPDQAYELGRISAVMTHGNWKAYEAAGLQAELIALLIMGFEFGEALRIMTHHLESICEGRDGNFPELIQKALNGPVDVDHGKWIDDNFSTEGKYAGGGWDAPHAFAIALYACAVAKDDPIRAVKIAVNHSGDSDTTGCIAGAIMGAFWGRDPFDEELKRTGVRLEAYDEAVDLAKDLVR